MCLFGPLCLSSVCLAPVWPDEWPPLPAPCLCHYLTASCLTACPFHLHDVCNGGFCVFRLQTVLFNSDMVTDVFHPGNSSHPSRVEQGHVLNMISGPSLATLKPQHSVGGGVCCAQTPCFSSSRVVG